MNSVKQNFSLNSKKSDVPINEQIRSYEIDATDWELQKAAREFYLWYDRFNKKFFNSQLSQAVLSFEKTRIDCLGHYVIEKNGIGVEDNINLNYKYLNRKKWRILVTLLHEMVHQYQRRLGGFSKKGTYKTKAYHNKEFKNLMASFGLICGSRGHFLGNPKDPFVSFLREHGVEVDEEPESEENPQKNVLLMGESKLKKFSCSCNPPINIRVADSRFSAKCNHCGKDFEPAMRRA